MVELSAAQVNQVVHAAIEGGNLSLLLGGVRDSPERLAQAVSKVENVDSTLSSSLLSGLLLLASLPADGSYIANIDVARRLGMNPSTAHRYINTFVAVGLVEKNPASRKYRLMARP